MEHMTSQAELPAHVTRGEGVCIQAQSIQCGRNVVLGDGVKISARELVLGDDVRIESECELSADILRLDWGSRIERRTILSSLRGPAAYVHIGEHSLIGSDSRVLVPVLVMGDYVAIQNHALINGLKPVRIGHNSWVGQNCVLNANESLSIGNNVGIGAYSSLYTHGFFGDLLEGCQVHKVAPVTLEDDAWILGSYNVISPGVTVGAKALVLTGSNVTRDVPPNHCVGGAPARDVTDRLTPFRPLSKAEKLEKMSGFLQEYVQTQYPGRFTETAHGYRVEAPFGVFGLELRAELRDASQLAPERPLLLFVARSELAEPPAQVSVFDLMQRTYVKQRTRAEVATIAWLKNPRARFVPSDRPRVTVPPAYL
jgi:acetyltransferase-like isoleucine patch superfamily enzyme